MMGSHDSSAASKSWLKCRTGHCEMKRFPCRLPLRPADSETLYKKTIDDLPNEMLAICLSYTGENLPNVRLTCRRFNLIVEENQSIMNVIPGRMEFILDDDDYNHIHVVFSQKLRRSLRISCRVRDIMKFIRFCRPSDGPLTIQCQEGRGGNEFANVLPDSWNKGIRTLKILGSTAEALSFLPIFCYSEDVIFLLAESPVPIIGQICDSLVCIRQLDLPNIEGENDDSLDKLLQKSLNSPSGIEYLCLPSSSFSLSAVIRFLENAKFSTRLRVSITLIITNYVIRDEIDFVGRLRQGPGYFGLLRWMDKQEARGRLHRQCHRLALDMYFKYRSSNFALSFH